MYEIKFRRLRSQILTCFIFLILLSKKSQKATLQKKMIVEEELDGIEIDDFVTLCWNLI